jgi:hypothetical protein
MRDGALRLARDVPEILPIAGPRPALRADRGVLAVWAFPAERG